MLLRSEIPSSSLAWAGRTRATPRGPMYVHFAAYVRVAYTARRQRVGGGTNHLLH